MIIKFFEILEPSQSLSGHRDCHCIVHAQVCRLAPVSDFASMFFSLLSPGRHFNEHAGLSRTKTWKHRPSGHKFVDQHGLSWVTVFDLLVRIDTHRQNERECVHCGRRLYGFWFSRDSSSNEYLEAYGSGSPPRPLVKWKSMHFVVGGVSQIVVFGGRC
jgi:hypothetical protein